MTVCGCIAAGPQSGYDYGVISSSSSLLISAILAAFRQTIHYPAVQFFRATSQSLAIHRAVEKPRRDDVVDPQTGRESGGLPMAVWNCGPAAFPTLGAAAQPCHFRVQAAFVDEDQLARIEIELRFEPGFSRGQDVVALLLRGVRNLFFHVMPRFLKNLEISD